MRAAEVLAEIGRLAYKTTAYDPKHPRRVEAGASALVLLGRAAGWRLLDTDGAVICEGILTA